MRVPKNWIFGQNPTKFGSKLAFLVKYQHFWPICSHANQKQMRTSCLCGFSIMWLPKLLITPTKIKIFGRKMAKFGPKLVILVIYGQLLSFLPIWPHARPNNNANKVPRWIFWVTKLLISPVKIRILARNWHFWLFWARPCRLIWCPVGGRP